MFTVNKRRMSHQLLLVILMITFSIVYSKVEPNDLEASRLIGKAAVVYSYRHLCHYCRFRLIVLLSWRFLLRQSAHKTEARHSVEKHRSIASADNYSFFFRDSSMVHLWVPDWRQFHSGESVNLLVWGFFKLAARRFQIPNFLGCILSTIQLALFVIYPTKTDIKYKPLTTEDVVSF